MTKRELESIQKKLNDLKIKVRELKEKLNKQEVYSLEKHLKAEVEKQVKMLLSQYAFGRVERRK